VPQQQSGTSWGIFAGCAIMIAIGGGNALVVLGAVALLVIMRNAWSWTHLVTGALLFALLGLLHDEGDGLSLAMLPVLAWVGLMVRNALNKTSHEGAILRRETPFKDQRATEQAPQSPLPPVHTQDKETRESHSVVPHRPTEQPASSRFTTFQPEGLENALVPIPPQSQGFSNEYVISTEHGDITLQVQTWNSAFRQDSLKYRTRRVGHAVHFPFAVYYPTFSNLTDGQLKWYLYWRNEWEGRRVHSTDLGYLFLFTYELLNLGYEPAPEQVYEKLVRLYDDYRTEHPKLEQYLPHWIGDFAWEMQWDDKAAYWYGQNDHTSRLVQQIQPAEVALPYQTAVDFVTDAGYRATAHFTKHRDEFLKLLNEHLKVLESRCMEVRGKSLLHVLNNGRKVGDTRYEISLYQGAVIGREVRARALYGYRAPYQAVPAMQNLIRCMENLHRVSTGNKTMLKVTPETLPKVVRQYLEEIQPKFTAPAQRPKRSKEPPSTGVEPGGIPLKPISFDMGLVERLKGESDSISTVLEKVLGGGEATEEALADTELSPSQAGEEPPQLVSDLTSLLGSHDVGEMGQFFADLNPHHRQFLSLFQSQNRVSKKEAGQAARQQGLMLMALIDDINQHAVDVLGDPLIEEGEESLLVHERWDELASMLHGKGIEL